MLKKLYVGRIRPVLEYGMAASFTAAKSNSSKLSSWGLGFSWWKTDSSFDFSACGQPIGSWDCWFVGVVVFIMFDTCLWKVWVRVRQAWATVHWSTGSDCASPWIKLCACIRWVQTLFFSYLSFLSFKYSVVFLALCVMESWICFMQAAWVICLYTCVGSPLPLSPTSHLSSNGAHKCYTMLRSQHHAQQCALGYEHCSSQNTYTSVSHFRKDLFSNPNGVSEVTCISAHYKHCDTVRDL